MVSYGLGNAPRTKRAVVGSMATSSSGGGPRCQCSREEDNTCRNFCRMEKHLRCVICILSHFWKVSWARDQNNNPNTDHSFCRWYSKSPQSIICVHVRTSFVFIMSRNCLVNNVNGIPLSSCAVSGMRRCQTRWSAPPRAMVVPRRSANTSWQPTRAGLKGKTTCSHSMRLNSSERICKEINGRGNYNLTRTEVFCRATS